jgi:hypothetical protein
MKRWIYIILLSGWSQIAISQTESYSFNIEWDGKQVLEVIGEEDSVLIFNRSYSLARGVIFVYSNCQLDSLKLATKFGDGLRTALDLKWDQGYAMGYNDGMEWQPKIYDIGFGLMVGSLITWAIITQLDSERDR